MPIEVCRAYLRQRGFEERIMEFDVSSATVELNCQELPQLSNSAGWIDVCKGWQASGPQD